MSSVGHTVGSIAGPLFRVFRVEEENGLLEMTHTGNGYDPLWVEAINNALEDRGSLIRVVDIDRSQWERHIGPMLDDIEHKHNIAPTTPPRHTPASSLTSGLSNPADKPSPVIVP